MKRARLALGDAKPVVPAAAPAAAPAPPAVEPAATSTRPEASAEPGAVQTLAVREVLGLSLRLLPLLPLPSTILCVRVEGFDAGGGLVVLTTSRLAYEAARARRHPVFVGGELAELALAAEHDRVYPPQLAAWCVRKLEDPAWRLSRAVAFGGMTMPSTGLPPGEWTLEQVTRKVGLRVLWAGCGDELPVEIGGPPAPATGEARAA